jgi:hypothetical protein
MARQLRAALTAAIEALISALRALANARSISAAQIGDVGEMMQALGVSSATADALASDDNNESGMTIRKRNMMDLGCSNWDAPHAGATLKDSVI